MKIRNPNACDLNILSDRPSYELLSHWTQILPLGCRTFTPAEELLTKPHPNLQ